MKLYALAAVLLLNAPSFALAGQLTTTCATADKSTVIEVDLRHEGGYEEIVSAGEVPADALARILKREGRVRNEKPLAFSGTGFASAAAGPFFELTNAEGMEIAISAPGSGAPSLLKIGERILPISCD